jgi:hypothetical protein
VLLYPLDIYELTLSTPALVGMNVFAGILLAELFIITSNGVHVFVRAASMVLTPILLVLSLTLMSVPMVCHRKSYVSPLALT